MSVVAYMASFPCDSPQPGSVSFPQPAIAPETEALMRDAVLKQKRCWLVDDGNGRPVAIWGLSEIRLESIPAGFKICACTWAQAIEAFAKSGG